MIRRAVARFGIGRCDDGVECKPIGPMATSSIHVAVTICPAPSDHRPTRLPITPARVVAVGDTTDFDLPRVGVGKGGEDLSLRGLVVRHDAEHVIYGVAAA